MKISIGDYFPTTPDVGDYHVKDGVMYYWGGAAWVELYSVSEDVIPKPEPIHEPDPTPIPELDQDIIAEKIQAFEESLHTIPETGRLDEDLKTAAELWYDVAEFKKQKEFMEERVRQIGIRLIKPK